MAYVRGNSEDYESWARLVSDAKWGWKSVESIYKRMENCKTLKTINPFLRGMNGPLHISVKQPINRLAQLFVDACAACGYKVGDYNGKNQECASVLQTTTKNGARCSAADAYIWPIISERENLHVLLNTEVVKIITESIKPDSEGRSIIARGVQVLIKGKYSKIIKAKKEVILSASAVGSPKLLLLSGIGPKNELEAINIPCILDLPDVGKNLEDHILVPILVNWDKGTSIGTVNKHNAENFPLGLLSLFQWLFTGTGNLASSAYDTCLFFKSGINPSLPFPDIQLGALFACLPKEFWINNMRTIPDGIVPEQMYSDNGQGFVFLAILLHPYSKGYITLRSNKYSDKPIIVANYFTDSRDLETLATGVKKSVEIIEKMGFKNEIVIRDDILSNISRNEKLTSLDYWKEICRNSSATVYHPCSTCAIGKVVDTNLQVNGIRNLRIADASVFPHLTSGNTNAPAIMIGEMASDIIKQKYFL